MNKYLIDVNELLSRLSTMHRKLIEDMENDTVTKNYFQLAGKITQIQEIIQLIRETETK